LDIIFASMETMNVWETSKTIIPFNIEFEKESSIYTGENRSKNRGDEFLLKYRRKIAKRKYRSIADARYMISRKYWKLITPIKRAI